MHFRVYLLGPFPSLNLLAKSHSGTMPVDSLSVDTVHLRSLYYGHGCRLVLIIEIRDYDVLLHLDRQAQCTSPHRKFDVILNRENPKEGLTTDWCFKQGPEKS
jgi:hypothetical protein